MPSARPTAPAIGSPQVGSTAVATKAPSKPRLDCIDGCRFALVLPIVIAHFARFGTSNRRLLKLLLQENILVGGFFVISGYVAAYTATKVGERSAEEKKLVRPELFFWQKVMGYYPLHFLVSTVFAPMFIWTERMYNTKVKTTALRAILNYSLMQAWFPKEAEIWNQPTWFLSALTFCNFTMPLMLRPLASLSKQGLWKLMCALTSISVLQKFSYSESALCFHSRDIASTAPKHPLMWNLTRFHPIWALAEMAMGVVAARDVMLDTEQDKRDTQTKPLVFFIAAHATLLLRLTSFDYNDALIRSTLFVPLYTMFLTAMHRDCLSEEPSGITRFFGSKTMSWLGSLAFPMFILHGPIGQIFYKKAIAQRLWGAPLSTSFFPAYLAIVLIASAATNEGFVKNRRVQLLASRAAEWLATRTQGMLQDGA